MEPNTNPQPQVLVQPVALELIVDEGIGCPVSGELRYDSHDPYAVTFVVGTQECSAAWTFARDLLVVGLCEPAGDGDVHVWPGLTDAGRTVLLLELVGREDDLVLAADPAEVSTFVTATLDLVRPGSESEHVDVDALIEAILSSVSNDRSDG